MFRRNTALAYPPDMPSHESFEMNDLLLRLSESFQDQRHGTAEKSSYGPGKPEEFVNFTAVAQGDE